jgi:hypothetical protein
MMQGRCQTDSLPRNYPKLLVNNDLPGCSPWADSQILVHLTQRVVDFSQAGTNVSKIRSMPKNG